MKMIEEIFGRRLRKVMKLDEILIGFMKEEFKRTQSS